MCYARLIAVVSEWTPDDWVKVIGAAAAALTLVGGGILAGLVKLLAGFTDLKQRFTNLEKATNGNMARLVSHAANEVRIAAKVNPLDDTAFPTTPEQLAAFAQKAASIALEKHQSAQQGKATQ